MVTAIFEHSSILCSTLGCRAACNINIDVANTAIVSITIQPNEVRYLVGQTVKLILRFRADAAADTDILTPHWETRPELDSFDNLLYHSYFSHCEEIVYLATTIHIEPSDNIV